MVHFELGRLDAAERDGDEALDSALVSGNNHLAFWASEGGTRRFIEEVALGPGAWQQLPRELRDTFVGNAPAFVADTGDPRWGTVDLGALSGYPGRVLLTQGDQSPAWFGEIIPMLARAFANAEVRCLAGAGHAPHRSHPDEYADAVRGLR